MSHTYKLSKLNKIHVNSWLFKFFNISEWISNIFKQEINVLCVENLIANNN